MAIAPALPVATIEKLWIKWKLSVELDEIDAVLGRRSTPLHAAYADHLLNEIGRLLVDPRAT